MPLPTSARIEVRLWEKDVLKKALCHEWRFKLESGANMQNPELFIPTYPVKVRNDNIYIGLEGESGDIAYGKKAYTLPSSLKFSVPTIQKPRNPEEELD